MNGFSWLQLCQAACCLCFACVYSSCKPIYIYIYLCVSCLVTVVGKLRMQLSDTNCVCCASNFRVGRALVCSVPGLAMRLQPRVTSLGSPLGAGTRRNAKVAQARLESFRRLRAAGVSVPRLMTTGGVAALKFGQTVMGVSNKALLQ